LPIIVIKPEVLSPEYRRSEHQLKTCQGGFGASPTASGTAVFCTDLYSGKESRFERYDVAGVIDPAKMPDWAVKKIALMESQKAPGVFEYGGYHFVPYHKFKKGEVTRRLKGDSRPWKTDVQYEMRNMRSDHELGLSRYDWKRAKYSHEGFYAASGGSDADIFRCIENGRLYVPYFNELFQYTEPPQKMKSKNPSLLGKVDENKQRVERDKQANIANPMTKKCNSTEITG